MHKSHDSKGNISTFYDTTIDFQSSDGAKHEFHDQIAGVRGQNVEVVYLEKNPETVLVFSFSNLWFLPGGFIFLGSIFFVLMLYLLVSMRKRDKEIGRLIDSGIRGVGIIVGAIQIGQGSTLVNGRRMQIFKIVVKTTDPSNKKELQINSDCICISLNIASITDIVGKEVPVYFDQNNSSSYFVELRDIEQYDINLAPNQPSS
jgi:hypothetical protein